MNSMIEIDSRKIAQWNGSIRYYIGQFCVYDGYVHIATTSNIGSAPQMIHPMMRLLSDYPPSKSSWQCVGRLVLRDKTMTVLRSEARAG